jgi:hypothetical protein
MDLYFFGKALLPEACALDAFASREMAKPGPFVPSIEWNSSSLRERAFDLLFVGGLHWVVDSDWGSAIREPFARSLDDGANVCDVGARKLGFWLAARRIADSPKSCFRYEHRRLADHHRGHLDLWDRLQPNQYLHATPRGWGKVRDPSYLQTGDRWRKNSDPADRRFRSGEPPKNHTHGDGEIVRRSSTEHLLLGRSWTC